MVVSWQSSDSTEAGILARGNFSLDAGGLANLLLALAVVSLGLAGLLALQGYWPVLLIAVIQLILVAWILVRTWEKTWVSDEIEVSAEKIRVTQRRHRETRCFELETAWAVIEWRQPDIAWYNPRVLLRSGSIKVELGSFLTREEQQQLVRHISCAIEKHSVMKSAIYS